MSTMNENIITCDCCGCVIGDEDTRFTAQNGDTICEACYENEYGICEHCGDIVPLDEMYSITCGGFGETVWTEYWCEDCAESNAVRCDECGKYMAYGSSAVWANDGNRAICMNCCDDYIVCEECGDIVHLDYAICVNDCYYCEDCAPETLISDYHCSRDSIGLIFHEDGYEDFYLSGGLYLGVELETDDGDAEGTAEYIRNHERLGPDVVTFEHDGSLDDGVEIISQPGTLAWHLNSGLWESVCEAAEYNNMKSHDTTTCGLHVHVSRSYFGAREELVIDCLYIILDNLWEKFVKFSRRGYEELNHWAGRTSVGAKKDDSGAELERKCGEAKGHYDRYRALNTQNRNTLEFRLFRGTLKVSTIQATLQLVDNLCRLVAGMDSREQANTTTWGDIINYRKYAELDNYCEERSI